LRAAQNQNKTLPAGRILIDWHLRLFAFESIIFIETRLMIKIPEIVQDNEITGHLDSYGPGHIRNF
jgi:hypothetical protein